MRFVTWLQEGKRLFLAWSMTDEILDNGLLGKRECKVVLGTPVAFITSYGVLYVPSWSLAIAAASFSRFPASLLLSLETIGIDVPV